MKSANVLTLEKDALGYSITTKHFDVCEEH